jgi:glyoxylase-like metal-dependent hydrolase (beta-lactamase superfamily II)
MTDAPDAGQSEEIAPGIRRIIAPNPGPMTYWGTNTYVIGRGDVAVVDPGPAMPAHLDAILAATNGEAISHILVTHAHLDHSPLARGLSEVTGAPVYGFGPWDAGRSDTMQALASEGLTGGGEGVDTGFDPDIALRDGDVIRGSNWQATALWTPGHFAGHLAFAMGDVVLSGDLVMGWSSTLISPPDGDLAQFMASSERLAERGDRMHLPGHGDPVTDPRARLNWLMEHRRDREAQILVALGTDPKTLSTVTEEVYTDIAAHLLPAAARNVFAHLIDLTERGIVQASPRLGLDAGFAKLS